MNKFAALLDRLSYEPRRLGKLALLEAYFRSTPDPDRGWALAAIAGDLSFTHAKRGVIRDLAGARLDPTLLALSRDFVGDLAETIALMWTAVQPSENEPLTITAIVEGLEAAPKAEIPALITSWLDRLDENGRWALLKLVTGALRIGVSARLARQALARLGDVTAEEIEDAWHASAPPFAELFAWVEGRAPRPQGTDSVRFHPPMLAYAWEARDHALAPADFIAEWKWDGVRVQAAAGHRPSGDQVARLYSRTGDDISRSFPDIVSALHFNAVLDGELLIRRGQAVQSFNTLQQRLNRKTVNAKTTAEYPAFICAYDLLSLDGEDLRARPFRARRALLERFVHDHPLAPLALSPLVSFDSWSALEEARANPAALAGLDSAEAIEGVMIKRADSPYLAGRPKGYWYKWKRDPHVVDAVLMYAQRGSGKRSSFYSDYTFGVWRGDELTPVGKAYFGFTDEELTRIDRFVRAHTVARFGPVHEIEHTPARGLVFEVAFEGLQRSARHKSGLAMRFPRISRIRWDKAPRDADQLATLEALLSQT